MTLRAIEGGRAQPGPTVIEQAFLTAIQKWALTLDEARGELWDGLAAQDVELVRRATRRVASVGALFHHAEERLIPPDGGAA